MDLFAAGLLSITILTICGICFFILICAIQPTILRYYHQRTRARSLMIAKIHHSNESLRRKSSMNDSEQRAYLKILERSVRTGRPIVEEETKQSSTCDFLSRYIPNHHHHHRTSTVQHV